MIVVEAVSACVRIGGGDKSRDKPLFSVPQHSHFRIEFFIPLEGSSRLPQSVQKTRDPIADILCELGLVKP